MTTTHTHDRLIADEIDALEHQLEAVGFTYYVDQPGGPRLWGHQTLGQGRTLFGALMWAVGGFGQDRGERPVTATPGETAAPSGSAAFVPLPTSTTLTVAQAEALRIAEDSLIWYSENCGFPKKAHEALAAIRALGK